MDKWYLFFKDIIRVFFSNQKLEKTSKEYMEKIRLLDRLLGDW